MTLNVSNFRQEVSKSKLSKNAFNELLAAQDKLVPDSLTHRIDVTPARLNSQCSGALLEELGTVRNMIDPERHVLLIDGFKVNMFARFKSRLWTLSDSDCRTTLNRNMLRMWFRKPS